MEDRTFAHRLFLIGSHASTAMSPSLWNQVFTGLGNRWSYQPWDMPSDAPMAAVLSGLLSTEVVGANVTMPHKQWAARAADEQTEQVRHSGAANLLVRKGGALIAHNTDVSAVESVLGAIHQRHVLMLGAGGAARAAIVALRGNVDWLTVTDRDPEAAHQLLNLASRMGISGTVESWDKAEAQAGQASLIVNATPIGKDPGDGPAWGTSKLAPGTFVYDFVYADHSTGTISAAKEQGLAHADGWQHLRMQAEAMIPLLDLPRHANALLGKALAQLQAKL